MDYKIPILITVVAVALILVNLTTKEDFVNPLNGNYLQYLTSAKSPGYCALKKSTLNNGVLRIFYPKGACGKDKTETCGISAVAVYPDNLNPRRATLSADVLFETGFVFDGGKLGLGFEMGSAGATGGHANSTASSCRVIFKKGGSASCYIYVPLGSRQTDAKLIKLATGQSVYGAEFFEANFPQGSFKVGVKNRVKIGVKMNTPGRADGECFMTINGTTMRKVGIMWLTSNVNDGITRVNNTSFIGGDWVSSKDQYVQMSNMKLVDTFPVFQVNSCNPTEFKYNLTTCK